MARFRQAQAWVEQTILWKVWERLLENEFIDRSVALAAKAFVSLFPALIVVAAFAPDSVRTSIVSTVTRRLGVTGEGLTTIRGAFASSNDVRRATGIIGLIFTFFYVNSFVTALQRVFTRSWRRPKAGRVSGYALGAAWLVAIIAYFTLLGGARALLGRGPETVAYFVFAFAATIGIWTLTPWFLLLRQVRLRALVPTGILAGTGMAIYAATATIWMPNTVTSNQHQFGFFGVALALVTWLTGAATIIVVSTCAGAVLAEDTGTLGRLARGSDDAPILAAGAPPSLPAPTRPFTLSSAIALQRDDRGLDGEPDLEHRENDRQET